jgi:hypothetical protein
LKRWGVCRWQFLSIQTNKLPTIQTKLGNKGDVNSSLVNKVFTKIKVA